MLTAETGFSAPTTPNADPHAAFAPANFAAMPHPEVEALMESSAEVTADAFHVTKSVDGREGVRTAEGYVSLFRVGQVVNLVAGDKNQAVRSLYMGHDGELRDYDANAEFLPIEVRSFRQGLADRYGYPQDARRAAANGEDIGAYVVDGATSETVRTPRFARLKRLGKFVLDEAKQAAQNVASQWNKPRAAEPAPAEMPAPASAPTTGRHRYDPSAGKQVHGAYSPGGYQRRTHTGRHRRG